MQSLMEGYKEEEEINHITAKLDILEYHNITIEEILSYNENKKYYYLTEPDIMEYIINDISLFIKIWNSFSLSQKKSYLEFLRNKKLPSEIFLIISNFALDIEDIKAITSILYIFREYYTILEHEVVIDLLKMFLVFQWPIDNDFLEYATIISLFISDIDINYYKNYHIQNKNNKMVLILLYSELSTINYVDDTILSQIDSLIITFKYDLNSMLFYLINIIFDKKELNAIQKHIVNETYLVHKIIWSLHIDIQYYNILPTFLCINIIYIACQYINFSQEKYIFILTNVLKKMQNYLNEIEDREIKEQEEEQYERGEQEEGDQEEEEQEEAKKYMKKVCRILKMLNI